MSELRSAWDNSPPPPSPRSRPCTQYSHRALPPLFFVNTHIPPEADQVPNSQSLKVQVLAGQILSLAGWACVQHTTLYELL